MQRNQCTMHNHLKNLLILLVYNKKARWQGNGIMKNSTENLESSEITFYSGWF